jgi:hypothetical protein
MKPSAVVQPVARGFREVRDGGGQSLDLATRAFMEPRFGHDFSQVRVHTDAKAARSARAINALAYTVGSDIVFGSGCYSPATAPGQRLLAHELAHVLQRSNENVCSTELNIGSADSPLETEANRIADSVLRRPFAPLLPVSHHSKPAIHRWKITGNTAVSDDPSDTLGRLAQRVGARFNDWKCIRPVRMRTNDSGKAPPNFDDRYELYVQKGDEFDISNLKATTGSTSRIHLFDEGSEAMDAALAKLFYSGSISSLGADEDFENASGSGSTPIVELVVFGHSGGNSMWGGASRFTPSDFDPEEPAQTFALANAGLFPRRCWLTRNATARLVGCDSDAVGRDFVRHYLRKGATVATTTESVRPKCSAPLLDPATRMCTAYDGVDFATSPSPAAASLDGPFWNVSDFHGGRYWATLRGQL